MSDRGPTERELKFSRGDDRVPPAAELAPALEAAGLGLGEAGHTVHDDRYYDDARLSLSRAGLALRRRLADGRVLAALKAAGAVEGALHRREELELPVPDDATALDPWPQAIAERLRTVTDPRQLSPVLELRTARTTYTVTRRGSEVARLSFDAVEARRPRRDASVRFDELEVEAVGEAPDEALEAVADALRPLVALTPSATTKLERARALLLVWE